MFKPNTLKEILLFSLCISFFVACKDNSKTHQNPDTKGKVIPVDYANGFSLKQYNDYKILKVTNPWPDSERNYTYVLTEEKNTKIPDSIDFDTKHIPAIESLKELSSLKGFPGLDYISSEKVRNRIANGKIKELGKNESLNTEVLLNLNPNAIVAFSMNNENKSLSQAKKAGIPVIYNGDWTESNPLGKAEWIKFFGALYGKLDLAEKKFDQIETDYKEAIKIISTKDNKPSVLAGSLYKDVWYLPYGNSWQGKMIADAGGNYLYKNTKGSGSISLSLEEVLNKGTNADKWIAPGSFKSYLAMRKASEHYAEFDAFKNREIYTFASTTGKTGGVLYYELAPQRPDLVLKDLIKIFHPEKLPDYEPTFFKPLKR